MENLSDVADKLVAISMTYKLPPTLDAEIVKLIPKLYFQAYIVLDSRRLRLK